MIHSKASLFNAVKYTIWCNKNDWKFIIVLFIIIFSHWFVAWDYLYDSQVKFLTNDTLHL